MGFSQKPRATKRNFSFSGLLTCGHCGCSITPEFKRKKSGKTYIYYHCTNGKGICDNVTYLPEGVLEEGFAAALKKIQPSSEVVEWTRKALLESSKDEREQQASAVAALTKRFQKLSNYVSQAYEDKLEGRIELER